MESSQIDPSRLVSSDGDRRMFRRFSQNMLVFVRLVDPRRPSPVGQCGTAANEEALRQVQPAPVKDISMTGLFFYSPLSYPSKGNLEVRVCLDRMEYVVSAVIERRLRINNTLCGYGVSFAHGRTSRELRVALAAFLLRLDTGAKEAPAPLTARKAA